MPLNRDIHEWDPDDQVFWEREGRAVARRNLWISIPSLAMGFAVWTMWGMIAAQMLNLGFPFSETELFTLAAIAGLTGATLRIPAAFMIRIAGGRNTVFLTTALLVLPALGAGLALQSKDVPLWVFQLLAFLSGIGGGNFAAFMSNIASFFPGHRQGLALGMNAGLGNLGVTLMQILVPLVMTAGVFGAIAGDPMVLERASGTLIGHIEAGTETWIQNAGLVWLVFLVPLAALAWFGMNNLCTMTPHPGHPLVAFARIIGLYGLGFAAAAIGLYLFLPEPVGLGIIDTWLMLPLVIVLVLGMMRMLPGSLGEGVKSQFAIFRDRHTWLMTLFYLATFGTFIGFSVSLPLAIEVLFGQMVVDGQRVADPDAPSALTYAWIGPLVGALIRPIGGWLSDRVGGSIVTQVVFAVMLITSIAAGHVMMLAYQSAAPNEYFNLFIVLFVVLFAASGIGSGSIFRSIGVIFDRHSKGPVLGWASAVAAYGAFIAPRAMGEQIGAGSPESAMFAFAAFYTGCLVLNGWYFLRRDAFPKNP